MSATDRLDAIQRGVWVHTTTPRPEVGQTPHTIVHTHDKLVVRHYARDDGPARGPVVVVPSLINRAWICDLEPGRSLVQGLAALGHDVYLIDWGVPGDEDADEDVGYVLDTLLRYSVHAIARHASGRPVHLFGYCMGGTLAAMFAANHPARLASLSTLAAPVYFRAAGRFRDLVAPLDVDEVFPAGRLVPVEAMEPAFKLLDPLGNWTKYEGIDHASRDVSSLRRAMARERWLEENVPISGAFAREFIRNAYQEDRLISGTWAIGGKVVDLGRIGAPTLVVACRNDFVAPPDAVTPLAQMVTGARLELVDSGHIGVVVGSRGPSHFYPMLDAFFREVEP